MHHGAASHLRNELVLQKPCYHCNKLLHYMSRQVTQYEQSHDSHMTW